MSFLTTHFCEFLASDSFLSFFLPPCLPFKIFDEKWRFGLLPAKDRHCLLFQIQMDPVEYNHMTCLFMDVPLVLLHMMLLQLMVKGYPRLDIWSEVDIN